MRIDRMKKAIALCISVFFIIVIFAGCSTNTSKSYTFSIDNGDNIKISLNTADGYDISSDVPFAISCDGETLSQGSFIFAEYYEQYADVVNTDEKAVLIDSGSKDGNNYVFWCYDNSEYNYVIMVDDSNTGIILGNAVSEETAKECFNRLTISAEE